jgi:hypothetical protein
MNFIETNTPVFLFQKTLLIVLISTTVLELIPLLSLAGHWIQFMSNKITPKESNMCLPLRKLISAQNDSHLCPDGLKEKVNKTEETEETKLCCGSMSIVMEILSAKVHKQYHFYLT